MLVILTNLILFVNVLFFLSALKNDIYDFNTKSANFWKF